MKIREEWLTVMVNAYKRNLLIPLFRYSIIPGFSVSHSQDGSASHNPINNSLFSPDKVELYKKHHEEGYDLDDPSWAGPLSVAPGRNPGGLQVRSRLGVGFFFDLKFNSVLPCLILIGSLWLWVTHLTG